MVSTLNKMWREDIRCLTEEFVFFALGNLTFFFCAVRKPVNISTTYPTIEVVAIVILDTAGAIQKLARKSSSYPLY